MGEGQEGFDESRARSGPLLQYRTPVSNSLSGRMIVRHTQVLNILISSQHQRTLLLGASTKTSSVSLVDNNAIGGGCCNECKTIGSLRPSGVEIERNVGEEVSKDTE